MVVTTIIVLTSMGCLSFAHSLDFLKTPCHLVNLPFTHEFHFLHIIISTHSAPQTSLLPFIHSYSLLFFLQSQTGTSLKLGEQSYSWILVASLLPKIWKMHKWCPFLEIDWTWSSPLDFPSCLILCPTWSLALVAQTGLVVFNTETLTFYASFLSISHLSVSLSLGFPSHPWPIHQLSCR